MNWKKEQWRKHFESAVEYFHNAKEELGQLPVEDEFYADRKHLRRAAGVFWLAVTEAAKGFLLKRGVPEKKLNSTDALRFLLAGHHEMDGKLMAHYEAAMEAIHVSAYYRGVNKVAIVKAGVDSAKFVVETLTGTRL